MRKNLNILVVFLVLFPMIWVSCESDDGEIDVGKHLYFATNSEEDTLLVGADDRYLLTLTAMRSGDLSVREVPLTVVSSDSIFHIPEAIHFAAGASSANFTISYPAASPGMSYSFVLKLEEGETSGLGGLTTLARTIVVENSGLRFAQTDTRVTDNRLILTKADDLALSLGFRRSATGKKGYASLQVLQNEDDVFSFPEMVEFAVGDSVADITIPFPEVQSGRDYHFRLGMTEKEVAEHEEPIVCDMRVTVSRDVRFTGGGSDNSVEFLPGDELRLRLELTRPEAGEALSVPIEVLENEGNFQIPTMAHFAEGETVTSLEILFPEAQLGSYRLSLSVQDEERWIANSDAATYRTSVNIVQWEVFAEAEFTGPYGTFSWPIMKLSGRNEYKMENFIHNGASVVDFNFTLNDNGGIRPVGASGDGNYLLNYIALHGSWVYSYIYLGNAFSYLNAANKSGRLYFNVYVNGNFAWAPYNFTWN